MALREQHLKRRLAYSTVSNLSYILFGMSLMTAEVLVAGLSHMLFHGVIKITLFFCAGTVLCKTGRAYVPQTTGLGRKMPVTFITFLISGLALTGTPLLPGYISKMNLLMSAALAGGPFAMAGIIALLLSAILGITIGIFSAIYQNSIIDYVGRFFAVLGQAIPQFFFGICLIQIFSIKLGWLPSSGRYSTYATPLQHFILPAVTLTLSLTSVLMRYSRNNMLGVLNSDYIKTARMKGISEAKVYVKHAFRNAVRPVLVILCSRDGFDARAIEGFFNGMLTIALGYEAEPVQLTEELAIADPDRSGWGNFCGEYKAEGTGYLIEKIYPENGDLFAAIFDTESGRRFTVRLYPFGENTFGIRESSDEIVFGDGCLSFGENTCKKL